MLRSRPTVGSTGPGAPDMSGGVRRLDGRTTPRWHDTA